VNRGQGAALQTGIDYALMHDAECVVTFDADGQHCVDDIPALMKTAGCFVLPSRWEGMGIVLIEALASGCPVIAADFSAARGVLKDGSTGLIVPVEDAAALSASMLKVASDPLLRRKLSDAGAKDAERFSIATHIDRLLEYIV